MLVPCVLCGRPLDPDAPRVFQLVRGYELKREQGGTNALALREPLHQFAHYHCVDRKRSGIAPTQTSLLDG